MASLIPSLSTCLRKMQAGEKRFASRLESHLEDDYLCWYEVGVGARQRYTDFIVLHPQRGLLFLEVKDWKLDTIQRFDKATFQLLTPRGINVVANPLEQVRQCTYQLVQILQQDPQLVHSSGRYVGGLRFPYGYGVVFSNITRRQFTEAQMGEVIPSHQTICSDEMTASVDVETFQSRLWQMFNVVFDSKLTLPQMDRIRWHIFPEVRIDSTVSDLFASDATHEGSTDAETPVLARLVPDVVRVMDMQQEQLARSMGLGHRVIHGVAGSGKTMILGYRCLYLARILSQPILVICYNITLAARLRSMMELRSLGDRVQVYHFHDWCGEQLRAYNVQKPPQGPNYVDSLVGAVIDGVDKGQIPRGQYGALMIDEGHDFEAEWLRLIAQMVDPEQGSLLLLYDDAQSIYRSKKGLDFSLSSVGIQARGRTTILKVNYRNTDEVIRYAYDFASQYLSPSECDEDHVPLVKPESAGRSGPRPHLRHCRSEQEEFDYIAATLLRLHESGQPWREMCVTCTSKWVAERVTKALEGQGVPVYKTVETREKKRLDLNADTVKVMTMHSSKGLEFPVVAIPGVHGLPRDNNDPTSDARLLYVAMTRATEKLLLTASKPSPFVERLMRSRSEVGVKTC